MLISQFETELRVGWFFCFFKAEPYVDAEIEELWKRPFGLIIEQFRVKGQVDAYPVAAPHLFSKLTCASFSSVLSVH